MTTEQHAAGAATRQGGTTNGMGVGGFVTGLVGLGLSWLIPLAGIVLGVLGVVLGGVGVSQGRRRGAPTGLATAGVVLGALAIVAAVVVVWAVTASLT